MGFDFGVYSCSLKTKTHSQKAQKPQKTLSSYSPFGLKQKGYNYTVSGGNDLAQQWKFAGKELSEDLGLDSYDFGARNYDASLGRWFGVDNLAEVYHTFSPYHYSANNPILFVDLDGNGFMNAQKFLAARQQLSQGGDNTLEVVEVETQGGNSNAGLTVSNNAQSKKDLKSLVKQKNRNIIKIDNNGKVTLDFSQISNNKTTADILSNDEGLSLINDLVNSNFAFLYEASDIFLGKDDAGNKAALEIHRDANGVVNASNNGKDSSGSNTFRPRDGYDGQVVIGENVKHFENDYYGNEVIKSRASLVFHELAESYERTHNNINYSGSNGAHQLSINREGWWHGRSLMPGKVSRIVNPKPNKKTRQKNIKTILNYLKK